MENLVIRRMRWTCLLERWKDSKIERSQARIEGVRLNSPFLNNDEEPISLRWESDIEKLPLA